MRALLVSSLFAASALVFGGCAINTAPNDDEGRTGALSSAMLEQSDLVVTLHRAGRATERGEKIPGISFHYNIETPRDSASGQAEGKRPRVTITKILGGNVPPILEQLTLNENLEGIVFEFIQKTPTGQVTIIRRITLLNASVSELVRTVDSTGNGKLEQISFTSETLEVNDR